MQLPTQNRDAASNVLRMIRSKAIDTERLLMLDRLDAHQALERTAQIEGLAHVLALAILKDHHNAPVEA
jgi:hypothetical protein